MGSTAGPSALWYLTRGTGTVTLVLLTVSLALGIANVQRVQTDTVPRFVFDAVHRSASLLALAFLAVHIVGSVLDPFAPIRLIDTVVPFTSAYRPVWLGLGAVVSDVLIAVVVTSVLRRRFGYRAWRVTHWFAYACFPIALVHGLGTGSDAKTGWMLLLATGCVLTVLVAVWIRVAAGWPNHAAIRTSAVLASIAAPVALLVWLPSGPLGAGWAKRAGTPASLAGEGELIGVAGCIVSEVVVGNELVVGSERVALSGGGCVQRSGVRHGEQLAAFQRPGASGPQAERLWPAAQQARYSHRRPAAERRRGGDDVQPRDARPGVESRSVRGPSDGVGGHEHRRQGQRPEGFAFTRGTASDRSALERGGRRARRPAGRKNRRRQMMALTVDQLLPRLLAGIGEQSMVALEQHLGRARAARRPAALGAPRAHRPRGQCRPARPRRRVVPDGAEDGSGRVASRSVDRRRQRL